MQSMLELVEYGRPVTPNLLGGDVYERFEREIDTMAIAVVTEDGIPIGLIERNTFMLKFASPYGRALYSRRPVELLMDRDPIIADYDADVTQFTRKALTDRPSDLLKGFIVTIQDRYAGVGSALSLLKTANTANVRHLRMAESELKARDQLLSVMSHEIRTPLNGVLSVAEIINHELTQEALRPHVQAIIDSGGLLLRLMNDSLDFFRGEGGVLDLHEDSFEVARLLADAGALWKARASQAGLVLELVYEGPDDIWALGDTIRIKQIFNNLIGNALKFASKGVVRVTLSARVEDRYVDLFGEVSDQGPGVPQDKLATIFDPYAQTDVGRSHGGAGLGLAVCRQLVEKMGGAIRCESVLGQGARFLFNLVLFSVPAPVMEIEEAADEMAASGLHVLIADDNATNRFVAESLCKIVGCTCESVADGAEAVAEARSGRFDLVLMDIMMPVMDGIEAVRALRADPATSRLPVIALTANGDPKDALQYMAAGMNAVVEKPIRAEFLFAAMQAAMNDADARAAA
jgi:signal transduction histidine kinase/ActR/RegA family two-component response regulator